MRAAWGHGGATIIYGGTGVSFRPDTRGILRRVTPWRPRPGKFSDGCAPCPRGRGAATVPYATEFAWRKNRSRRECRRQFVPDPVAETHPRWLLITGGGGRNRGTRHKTKVRDKKGGAAPCALKKRSTAGPTCKTRYATPSKQKRNATLTRSIHALYRTRWRHATLHGNLRALLRVCTLFLRPYIFLMLQGVALIVS